MTRKLKVLLLLGCVFMAMNSNSLWAQKVGHINTAELLQNLPIWKSADTELQTYTKKLSDAIVAKEKAIQADYEKLLADQNNLAPNILKQKAGDIENRAKALEQERVDAQKKALKKEQDLTQPITQKVIDAINAVAAEKGYDYIIDTSTGAVLHADPGMDIMSAVKAKL
ncbi:MAG: OmpH family outer membrane protein [Chitinophagales bacterium]